MLAKPLKIAGATALPTYSLKLIGNDERKDGGTASTKRTQGSVQAAGEFASPLRLIQPRKCDYVEADLVTLRGRQHLHERIGKRVLIPPGSFKIVARTQRSEYR